MIKIFLFGCIYSFIAFIVASLANHINLVDFQLEFRIFFSLIMGFGLSVCNLYIYKDESR